jgi:hypothetical protein
MRFSGTIASAGPLEGGYDADPFFPPARGDTMKKIAIVGFLMGLIGYITARVIGTTRPKRLPQPRSPSS